MSVTDAVFGCYVYICNTIYIFITAAEIND